MNRTVVNSAQSLMNDLEKRAKDENANFQFLTHVCNRCMLQKIAASIEREKSGFHQCGITREMKWNEINNQCVCVSKKGKIAQESILNS
jgi:rubredoxin